MRQPALRAHDLATLREVFRRHPFVSEVRLFGSRATGYAKRASDIDLALFAPNATPKQRLDLTRALNEAPIIYEVDSVYIDQLDNPKLKARIAQDGIRIYPEGDPRSVEAVNQPSESSERHT